MRRCAFLTLDDTSDWMIDDELANEPLQALGWSVESIPWQRPGVAWDSFDVVVIRSPWDYTDHLDAFMAVLEEIERTGTLLLNGLELVRWNLEKSYLLDLAARGVPIVPTIWRDRLRPGELRPLLEEIDTPELIVKPVVGAGAIGTFRLERPVSRELEDEVEAYFADRALMAQPFVPAVTAEGEYSLIYFNGEFSHAILKTPKAGDFRVQEEWGGQIRPVEPDDALRAITETVLHAIDEDPFYARADLVRASDDAGYWLMELELIEPALYLRMDPQAPERFARALHERVGPGSEIPAQ